MSRDRYKTYMHLTGAFGLTCFVLALTTGHFGPVVDGHFGWATGEAGFRDVVLVGSVDRRWSRFAETSMILGMIGLGVSLVLSFMIKARHRDASDNTLDIPN